MGNSNKEFLNSLASVLNDLRQDYFQEDKHSASRVGNSPEGSQRQGRAG
jgi:hypothetical protein